jgi:hypothetical protein
VRACESIAAVNELFNGEVQATILWAGLLIHTANSQKPRISTLVCSKSHMGVEPLNRTEDAVWQTGGRHAWRTSQFRP